MGNRSRPCLLALCLVFSAPDAQAADVRAGQTVVTPTALTAPAGHWVLSTYDGLLLAGTYAFTDHIEATAAVGGAVVAWMAGGRLKWRLGSLGPVHAAVVGEGFTSVAGGEGGSIYRSMATAGLVGTVCLSATCDSLFSAGGGVLVYRRTETVTDRRTDGDDRERIEDGFLFANTHVALSDGVKVVGEVSGGSYAPLRSAGGALRILWTRVSLDLGCWYTPLSAGADVIPVVALSFGSAP